MNNQAEPDLSKASAAEILAAVNKWRVSIGLKVSGSIWNVGKGSLAQYRKVNPTAPRFDEYMRRKESGAASGTGTVVTVVSEKADAKDTTIADLLIQAGESGSATQLECQKYMRLCRQLKVDFDYLRGLCEIASSYDELQRMLAKDLNLK